MQTYSLYKRKNNRYYVRIRDADGKVCKEVSTGLTDRKEAEIKAVQLFEKAETLSRFFVKVFL